MILRRSRLVLVASFVACAAFVMGLGSILMGAPRAPHAHPAVSPSAPRLSGDDGGFSVTLTEPSETYLVGVKRILIEPVIPPGDSIVGVDFFVDGRLVATDRRPPFETRYDFGQEIRRHVIIATALTSGGRRAKVSFVSRAADLSGGDTTPLAFVPVVVREAEGGFVDGLSVSDFVLLEDGTARPILHFDDGPIPQSIAILLQAPPEEEARAVLTQGADRFLDSLPAFDSLGLLAVGALPDTAEPARPVAAHAPPPRPASLKSTTKPVEVAAPPALAFGLDREPIASGLGAPQETGAKPVTLPIAEALQRAARGLQNRPRGRVVVALLAGTGSEPETAESPAPTAAAPTTAAQAPGGNAAAPPQDLAEALELIRRSGTTLYVVVYGWAGAPHFQPIRKTVEETGGEFLVAASAPAVQSACRRISESLQHQYLVGFAPAAPEREGWRSIELRLRPPHLELHARRGFYSSPPPKTP